jgi:hypothetical protein
MKKLPTLLKKTNKTGVVGVAFTDRFCHSYIVNDLGKRLSRKFSIAKYGKDEALRLAIKWRRENELKIHGYSVIPKKLIREKIAHRQSIEKAETKRQLKKLAAIKYRQNKIREFAEQKQIYQKKAGKYIYRIDGLDSGHGWLLRIEFQNELLCNKLFRDSQYGSVREALRQAKKERKYQLKLHNIPYAGGRRFSKALRSTNCTGVTGVCRSNFFYHSYISLEPNKTKTRKFSINKYGDKLAFQLAVEWRQSKEIEVYGGTVLTDQKIDEIFAKMNQTQGNDDSCIKFNNASKLKEYTRIIESGIERNSIVAEVFPEYVGKERQIVLRAYRHRENLTQQQLSNLTGIPERHISDMENGKRPIEKETAERLSIILNADYKAFL